MTAFAQLLRFEIKHGVLHWPEIASREYSRRRWCKYARKDGVSNFLFRYGVAHSDKFFRAVVRNCIGV
jgi:hypothetical protein